MTSVSVALATLDGEAFLEAQLDSLARQTLAPDELVVVDDGSSDGTLRILRDFAVHAPFSVRVVPHEVRGGYAVAFMAAASACRGDLIAFCDQDDLWKSQKLERMRRAFEDPDVLVAFHASDLIDAAGRPVGSIRPYRTDSRTWEPLTLGPWPVVYGHALVVRRRLNRFTPLHGESRDILEPEHPEPHDLWYSFWASILGRTAYVAEPLVAYRQHGSNVVGAFQHNFSSYLGDNVRHAERYALATTRNVQRRLSILRRAPELAEGAQGDRIAACIRRYEALVGRCETRRDVYTGRTVLDRGRALLAALRKGVYGVGRFPGPEVLLLDAFIGMPTKRLGRSS